jgi:hypothetical protein
MSQPHTITITLHKDGKMTTVVDGIKGASCAEATQWLDRVGETVEHQPTAESFEVEVGVNLTTNF